MTEKDLIKQIKQLKDIKPRSEWVALAKSQMFAGEQEVSKIPAQKISIFNVISNSFSRRLAYSFATLLFICVGLVGFAQYTMPGDLLFPVRKITEKSEATLVGQTKIKQNVANLNNRINDLVKVAQEGKKDNISPAINEVSENAGVLAKNLKASGAEVQLEIWQDMFHVWHYFAKYLSEGRQAIKQIGNFIKKYS